MADSAGNTLSSANQRAAIASSAENCLTADQKARLTSDLLEVRTAIDVCVWIWVMGSLLLSMKSGTRCTTLYPHLLDMLSTLSCR